VIFKSSIYSIVAPAVADDIVGFTDHRGMRESPTKVFTESRGTKVDRPDTSPSLNSPLAMLGQTKELAVPSDILELYTKFQSLEWGNKQLFLMAAAVYRTALRLLVADERRWCGEAAQANLLLWSALEAIVGRGRKIKEKKKKRINEYIVKRLGDTELTQRVMGMWDYRCETAHQSIVWSWQLFDEEEARLDIGQSWEWQMQVSRVGAVERVVNAILIDYLSA
jgi:hypothetical protein